MECIHSKSTAKEPLMQAREIYLTRQLPCVCEIILIDMILIKHLYPYRKIVMPVWNRT